MTDDQSDDEVGVLARFAVRRHKAGAAFFARSRAAMFEEAGETADAARWHAVAARIDQIGRGIVGVPHRPRRP